MATCTRCNGFGRESCGVCWGGQRQILCMACSGRGYIKNEAGEKIVCTRCEGRKIFVPHTCPRCSNSYPCPDCGGTGVVD